MNKREFTSKLKRRLFNLPKQELKERISFYSEMIDDRIEDGLSEEEAVRAVGSIDEVVEQILSEIPELAGNNRAKRRDLKKWEIALIAIGSPVWASLLIAAFSVVFSLYITVWALVVTLWVVELPFFIFACISKALFPACKAVTEAVFDASKACMEKLGRLFGIMG